ncbi:MAG TPA: CvpA family protein [Candidatus Acidoferrales bacterium]|nr:CvpA family protein [Candidatus Acidoferrales bacterium]
MTWPDVVIIVIAVLGAYKGYRSGFIEELTGIIALVAAIVAGFTYSGFWDHSVENISHLGPGSAHVVGMLAFAGIIYAIVTVAGLILNRIASLPIIGIANALLGALVGFVKAMVFVWAILYIALFFPLPADLRNDLRHSAFVSLLTEPNGPLDERFHDSLPWFAKLFSTPFFSRHRM